VVNLGMWEQPANRAVASFDVRVVETFDSFARREQRGLVALAYGLIGDLQAAEEVTQDALFAASRRWNTVGQYDSPIGWVRRVVANRSTSRVRRRFADAQRFARLISRHSESSVVPLMPSESEHIWVLVRRLPRRQAQVITLKALYRMSLEEIGLTLGLSKQTVQTHLARAKTSLINGGLNEKY
jgi:RNA polymerase sigma-70 factor, ECF subfamily